MRPRFLLALALVAPFFAASSHAGLSVCGGGSSNFYGGVLSEGFAPGTVKLEWTVWEDAWSREYRLSRYPSGCDRPSCATRVAKLKASSTAPTSKTYSVTETAPPGAWVYRLEVRRTHGLSCTMQSAEIVVPAPPACDTAALCSQVEASFAGGVISDVVLPAGDPATVRLQWLTHAETPAISGYRLSRYNCAVPRDCMTEVATVEATGTCGQVMLHSITDTPPPGTWKYRLEAIDSGSRSLCTVERSISR
jgi:hypothetical protein